MARWMFLMFGIVMMLPVLVGVAIGFGLGSSDGSWLAVAARIVAIAFGMLALLAVVSFGFFRRWRPVRHLIDAAGQLADGDYAVRVPVARSGSLRSVTTSFNAMAEQLEAAQAQRQRLLADIGHELRTPLTVIRGEIEAMVDGVHAPGVEHLEPLLDDVQVMERLLEDLRTLSQAEAGTLTLHREATDLADFIEDAAAALRREASQSGVALLVDTPFGLPDQLVDPVRLREVISNLVVNGIRAMPDGGDLTIRLATDGHAVTITVTDTGIGIPAEQHERVFARFHKGTDSTGTGLGLTISRDLVAAHGGTLELISSTGAGTVMRVTLPSTPA